ncbi:MAG: hypothetical protein NC084_09620 [Bacteroides sp.]|nr:hypothetical protein [Eubacterium sp.]MCM1419094.1 hypothetical protein [Roseburia sp.]MCM1462956.1 hypothetical protein [Bacteroides sp.]
MSIKGKYSESTPLYIALLSAGAVAAVVVFILVFNALGGGEGEIRIDEPARTSETTETTPAEDVYNPDEELSEEMKDEATRLLQQNYEVLRLYYTRGLPHLDEPYGNRPEDGYYTVDSDEYTSLAQLNALVDSTYAAEQAATVKHNSLGYGAIYRERDSGALGIIENFTPMEYDISWDNPRFSIVPVSDEECGISLTLHRRDSGEEVAISGDMIKTEDGWRLRSVLF